jgi:dolichol kinase
VSPVALRRLLHVASAAVLLPALRSSAMLRLGLLWVAVLAVLVEFARLASPRAEQWLATHLPVYRAQEARRASGALWLAFGYVIAGWLPMPAPVAGILAGAVADPAASWVGARWGKGARKSWAGSSAAFLVTVAAAMAVGAAPVAGVVAGLVGAALERWSGPFDDNLLVAPGVAVTVALLA